MKSSRNLRDREMPSIFQKIGPQLIHILGMPFFFVTFVTLYRPFNLETQWEFTKVGFPFCLTIVMCIILAVYVASRMSLFGVRHVLHISRSWYIFWCVMELILMSLFSALFLWLVSDHEVDYFSMLYRTAAQLSAILVIPYAIIILSISLHSVMRERETPAKEQRMRFYDERHNLKFVVDANSVLYIGAEENYVRISYEEVGSIKECVVRCSMKSIEESCTNGGLVRCHRSYFVNPRHVKVLRREKEGLIYAELDDSSAVHIPISKRYYDRLEALL